MSGESYAHHPAGSVMSRIERLPPDGVRGNANRTGGSAGVLGWLTPPSRPARRNKNPAGYAGSLGR